MIKTFIDTSVILRFLIKDDDTKKEATKTLIKTAKEKGILLYLLPVAILETVWVLEKVYKMNKKEIRDLAEAILNTPELRCEKEDVFRKALKTYEEKNIKFADAVMGYWGLENQMKIIYTYDNAHFKKIKGLEVRNP